MVEFFTLIKRGFRQPVPIGLQHLIKYPGSVLVRNLQFKPLIKLSDRSSQGLHDVEGVILDGHAIDIKSADIQQILINPIIEFNWQSRRIDLHDVNTRNIFGTDIILPFLIFFTDHEIDERISGSILHCHQSPNALIANGRLVRIRSDDTIHGVFSFKIRGNTDDFHIDEGSCGITNFVFGIGRIAGMRRQRPDPIDFFNFNLFQRGETFVETNNLHRLCSKRVFKRFKKSFSDLFRSIHTDRSSSCCKGQARNDNRNSDENQSLGHLRHIQNS